MEPDQVLSVVSSDFDILVVVTFAQVLHSDGG